MIEKIPRIRVETQRLKPQIKVWQNCYKNAVQIGFSAKMAYDNRALGLMAKVGMDGATALSLANGGKIQVEKEQLMAVLADIKKDRDKAILEKKHWDESVDKWRRKLGGIKPDEIAQYRNLQMASIMN